MTALFLKQTDRQRQTNRQKEVFPLQGKDSSVERRIQFIRKRLYVGVLFLEIMVNFENSAHFSWFSSYLVTERSLSDGGANGLHESVSYGKFYNQLFFVILFVLGGSNYLSFLATDIDHVWSQTEYKSKNKT